MPTEGHVASHDHVPEGATQATHLRVRRRTDPRQETPPPEEAERLRKREHARHAKPVRRNYPIHGRYLGI